MKNIISHTSTLPDLNLIHTLGHFSGGDTVCSSCFEVFGSNDIIEIPDDGDYCKSCHEDMVEAS